MDLVEAGGGLEELLVDGLFHLAADAEVGVDLQYTLDFGVGIGGSGGEECGEFVAEGLGADWRAVSIRYVFLLSRMSCPVCLPKVSVLPKASRRSS